MKLDSEDAQASSHEPVISCVACDGTGFAGPKNGPNTPIELVNIGCCNCSLCNGTGKVFENKGDKTMKDEEQPTVARPMLSLLLCDLAIDAICDFMNAWQEHNSDNCKNNRPFKSVSVFFLEYCAELRAKAN